MEETIQLKILARAMKLKLSIPDRGLEILENPKISINSRVEILRKIVSTKYDIPCDRIQMFVGGKQLKDGKTLLYYKVKENATIIVNKKVSHEVVEDVSKKIIERARYQAGNELLARCQSHFCWIPAKVLSVRVDEEAKGKTVYLYTIKYKKPASGAKKTVEMYETELRPTDDEIRKGSLVMVDYPHNKVYPSPQRYDADVIKISDPEDGEEGTVTLDLHLGRKKRVRVTVKRSVRMILAPRVSLFDDDDDEEEETAGTSASEAKNEEQMCDECFGRRDPSKCTSCGCAVCGRKNSQPRVYCDECLFPFHNSCADVPIGHVGDWYCKDCTNVPVEEAAADPAPKRNTRKRSRDSSASATTSKKAKKSERNWGSGMATASRNKVCKRVPIHHVGKIPGVLVGSSWKYRTTCGESGVHRPPVAGIHGTCSGAYSIVLSGGYDDDEDHGDWFVYSGSGGRELALNNKRTAGQSTDQVLTGSNLGLAMTCAAEFSNDGAQASKNWKESQPIRVVRSSKAKERSKFAPDTGYRYDGLYKIKKYWRVKGKSGLMVWLFQFHRDDKEPPPWSKQGKAIIKRHNLRLEWPKDHEQAPTEDDAARKNPEAHRVGSKVRRAMLKDKLNERNWEIILASAKNGFKKYYDCVEETFLCGICLNMVDKPVSLTCSHNFCQSCWTKSVNNGLNSCPTCRSPTDGKELKVNTQLVEALDAIWTADI